MILRVLFFLFKNLDKIIQHVANAGGKACNYHLLMLTRMPISAEMFFTAFFLKDEEEVHMAKINKIDINDVLSFRSTARALSFAEKPS
jgi:hypothetical protein